MSGSNKQPIIVRKRKASPHGAHGGAWKVAYADFVTAMMAFFLLLWLLNASSREQLRGISDYFSPLSTQNTSGGGAGLLRGERITRKGVLDEAENRDDPTGRTAETTDAAGVSGDGDLEERLREREQAQFDSAQRQLQRAMRDTPGLEALAKSLLVDNTQEGLRIQIIDQEGLPMFPRGESEMYPHTRKLLELVARVVGRVPQNIAITGHTDATRYQNDAAYSNWELSAGRANAARAEARIAARVAVASRRRADSAPTTWPASSTSIPRSSSALRRPSGRSSS